MSEENNLDKIPSRIKYYLLDWKDQNIEWFIKEYNGSRLCDLDIKELFKLFAHAMEQDFKLMAKLM